MKLSEMITKFNLEVLNTIPIDDSVDIEHCYIGDLLSQVLSAIKPNTIWMTIQRHLNVVGVAVMANIPAIVICEGHEVPVEVIRKADDEKVVLLRGADTSFILAGKLYESGIR